MKNFEIFPWSKEFQTGIDIIDEQHKVLVDLLNKLAKSLANRSSEITLQKILEELADYTDYHFKTEEKIWEKYLSDDTYYTEHIKKHVNFIDRIVSLKNDNIDSLDEAIYDIISFLSKWLAFHILDTDKRMAKTVELIEKGETVDNAKELSSEYMGGTNKVLINTVLNMYETLSTNSLDLLREKSLRQQAEAALNESEEKWKFILEGGVENVWDWNLNTNSFKSNSDDSILNLVGENLKIEGDVVIHPLDVEKFKDEFEKHMENKTEFFSAKYRILRKNGSWTWMLSRGKIVSRDEEQKPVRMVGTHSDITEREMASEIFNNSLQAIFISDMNNKIITINEAFTKLTGYKEEDVIGKDPKILASGKHEKDFYEAMWHEIDNRGSWQGEVYNKKKTGEIYPEYLIINTIKDNDGIIDHYFAIFDDITEKKKADEIIVKQANYDALTELANRNLFKKRLEEEIKRTSRFNIPFALLFIDLDNFKDINDSLGHDVGDLLLIEVAKRLSNLIRDIDTLARIGGDEFTIIYTNFVNPIHLEDKIKKITQVINEPFQLGLNQVHVSASIGVTICPIDSSNPTELLKNADQAMYISKNHGRNRYSYFTSSMQEEAKLRQETISDLHTAVEQKEFELFYQPIVDLKTNKIVKAEALIRWKHSTKGFISPELFIPFAESSGLIVDIGNWVFKEAMNQTKYWNDKYNCDLKISVNLSPIQFQTKQIVKEWLNYLEKIELPTKNCVLELTENSLMENHYNVEEKILELRNNGIKISLDDFGTGYSSLAYLQKFDIDYLKIDRSFIMNLNEENQDFALCEAIVSMSKKLGLDVIAEGVESGFQKDFLENLECDYIQGYYISKPLCAKDFEQLLK